MHVAELIIRGFRGIREAHVRFGGHTVLIGPNNSGKTTIIEAMALIFGRDRLVRDLTEHDFFGSDPTPGDRISIVATISGFNGDDLNRHQEWFRDDRAVPKWLDLADGTLHAERGRADMKLSCQIGFAGRFNRDELAVETIRYFHDDDDVGDVFDFDADVVRRVPTSIIREVGFFLVPANRTWDRTISFGSELFRRVVSSIGGRPAEAVLAERDRLRRPERPLEQDEGLREIVANVNAELGGLFTRPPSLKLRLTATDSESVLDAVMPHFVIGEGVQLPARRHGSGLISLQHLLLLLHFGNLRAERGEGFLMALEEPELHVPPPLQRRLIHRIQALSTQTIIATHSPIVASGCEPTSLLILQNRDGVLRSPRLLDDPVGRDAPNWKRTIYIARRQETVTALMHDVVLVPEGRTDFDLIRLLVDAVELRRATFAAAVDGPEFGSLVGVVPTPDAQVRGVFEELSRIHGDVLCLVDGDREGSTYVGTLTGLEAPPAKVLQWTQDWTIEDVLGWIAEADAAIVLPALSANFNVNLPAIGDLVELMKTPPREGGAKADHVVYESAVSILAENRPCLERVRLLLRRLAQVCTGPADPPDGWIREGTSTARTAVYRFRP